MAIIVILMLVAVILTVQKGVALVSASYLSLGRIIAGISCHMYLMRSAEQSNSDSRQ